MKKSLSINVQRTSQYKMIFFFLHTMYVKRDNKLMVSGLRFYEENVLVCDFHFIQVIK